MARPPIRGQHWSLNQLRTQATITRGFARAAVADGWLAPEGPYTEADVVVLRLAAQWMQVFPDTRAPSMHALADTARRLAKAVATDPATTPLTTMVATASQVVCPDTPASIQAAVGDALGQLVVLFPVGAWTHELPSRHRQDFHNDPSPAFPTSPTSSAVAKNPRDSYENSPTEDAPMLPLPTGEHPRTPPPAPTPAPTAEQANANPPRTVPMSAYQAYEAARDEIVAAATARQPQTYDSPGEPW